MRNSVFFLYAMLTVSLLLGGCGFKKGDPVEGMTAVDANYKNRDSTIYGVCGRATSMNSLQLFTDTGDTLQLSIAEAQEAGQVFGGIKSGERLAVVANADSTEALIVINMDGMLGDWVTEDAIDGGEEVGISIKDGGVAESINLTNIQYRSWRLVNGLLEIVNGRDGGGDFEEINLYHLVFIGPDSLVYKEVTRTDNVGREDVMEYTRQKPKEHFDPGFELEESNFEDFVF